MYLELAENGNDYLQENDEMYLDENGNVVEGEETLSPYIFVPGQQGQQGVYVREDYFDDLPDAEWEQLMTYLESNQPGMSLFGFGAKGRERRLERRERRHERKIEKLGAGGGIQGFMKGIGGIFGGGGAAPEAGVDPRTGQPIGTKKPVWPWVVGGGAAIVGIIALAGGFKRKPR